MRADLEALVKAAAGWDGVAQEVRTAREELSTGNGRGSEFGWFASRAGIDTEHDQFISSMIDAMATGSTKLGDVAQALRDTAKDFGATDLDVADEFHNPDGTPA